MRNNPEKAPWVQVLQLLQNLQTQVPVQLSSNPGSPRSAVQIWGRDGMGPASVV